MLVGGAASPSPPASYVYVYATNQWRWLLIVMSRWYLNTYSWTVCHSLMAAIGNCNSTYYTYELKHMVCQSIFPMNHWLWLLIVMSVTMVHKSIHIYTAQWHIVYIYIPTNQWLLVINCDEILKMNVNVTYSRMALKVLGWPRQLGQRMFKLAKILGKLYASI